MPEKMPWKWKQRSRTCAKWVFWLTTGLGALGFLLFGWFTLLIVVPGYTLALGIFILEALVRYLFIRRKIIKQKIEEATTVPEYDGSYRAPLADATRNWLVEGFKEEETDLQKSERLKEEDRAKRSGWLVKFHIVFEIDRGSGEPQIIKRYDDITINDQSVTTEEDARQHLKKLYKKKNGFIVDPKKAKSFITDLRDIPLTAFLARDITAKTLEIEEVVWVVKDP